MNAKEMHRYVGGGFCCSICWRFSPDRNTAEQCCGVTDSANEHNKKDVSEANHGFIAARCADREGRRIREAALKLVEEAEAMEKTARADGCNSSKHYAQGRKDSLCALCRRLGVDLS